MARNNERCEYSLVKSQSYKSCTENELPMLKSGTDFQNWLDQMYAYHRVSAHALRL